MKGAGSPYGIYKQQVTYRYFDDGTDKLIKTNTVDSSLAFAFSFVSHFEQHCSVDCPPTNDKTPD